MNKLSLIFVIFLTVSIIFPARCLQHLYDGPARNMQLTRSACFGIDTDAPVQAVASKTLKPLLTNEKNYGDINIVMWLGFSNITPGSGTTVVSCLLPV